MLSDVGNGSVVAKQEIDPFAGLQEREQAVEMREQVQANAAQYLSQQAQQCSAQYEKVKDALGREIHDVQQQKQQAEALAASAQQNFQQAAHASQNVQHAAALLDDQRTAAEATLSAAAADVQVQQQGILAAKEQVDLQAQALAGETQRLQQDKEKANAVFEQASSQMELQRQQAAILAQQAAQRTQEAQIESAQASARSSQASAAVSDARRAQIEAQHHLAASQEESRVLRSKLSEVETNYKTTLSQSESKFEAHIRENDIRMRQLQDSFYAASEAQNSKITQLSADCESYKTQIVELTSQSFSKPYVPPLNLSGGAGSVGATTAAQGENKTGWGNPQAFNIGSSRASPETLPATDMNVLKFLTIHEQNRVCIKLAAAPPALQKDMIKTVFTDAFNSCIINFVGGVDRVSAEFASQCWLRILRHENGELVSLMDTPMSNVYEFLTRAIAQASAECAIEKPVGTGSSNTTYSFTDKHAHWTEEQQQDEKTAADFEQEEEEYEKKKQAKRDKKKKAEKTRKERLKAKLEAKGLEPKAIADILEAEGSDSSPQETEDETTEGDTEDEQPKGPKIREKDQIKLKALPHVSGINKWLHDTCMAFGDTSMRGQKAYQWLLAKVTKGSFEQCGAITRDYVATDFTMNYALDPIVSQDPALYSKMEERREELTKQGGNMITGTQKLWMILEHYKTDQKMGSAHSLLNITLITLHAPTPEKADRNLIPFFRQWNHILNQCSDRPPKDQLETLFLQQVRKAPCLRAEIAIYETMKRQGDAKFNYDHLLHLVRDHENRIKEEDNRQAIVNNLKKIAGGDGGGFVPAAPSPIVPRDRRSRGKSRADRQANRDNQQLPQQQPQQEVHPGAPAPICSFFSRGTCKKGNACTFRHDKEAQNKFLEARKKQVCIDFYQNKCKEPCPQGRLHRQPTAEERVRLDEIIAGGRGRSPRSSSSSSSSRKGKGKGKGKGKSNICKNYLNNGKCDFQNCKFRHPSASARLTPRGTSYHKNGARTTPRGTKWTPRGSTGWTPRGSRMTPRGSRRTKSGGSYTPRGTRKNARPSSQGKSPGRTGSQGHTPRGMKQEY